MMWWKEIALLRKELQDIRSELEKEQGKATRLSGFLERLMAFGVSPAGHAPRQAYGEALVDSAHVLLKAEQVILFVMDPEALDYVPFASRGFTPQVLSELHVRLSEGATRPTLNDDRFLDAPYLLSPLLSQGQRVGLLAAAKPQNGSFSVEDRTMASLLAAQASLVLEGHSHYENVANAKRHTVAALARALEAKDLITHNHSGRTRALVRAMTQELALPEILVQQIEDGAFLHDIGKIGIPDAILKKRDELTPEEYAEMKTHAAIGRAILEPLPALNAVTPIVLYHQEWFNGTGYPEGLAGEEIPLGARIVQVIDAWDAMTSERTYRKAMPKAAAIAELRRQAGTQFDPKLVELFLRVLERLEREGVPTTELRAGKPLASQRA